MRLRDKKGADFLPPLIITIILVLLVLVILIIAGVGPFAAFRDTITGFITPVNVDSVKQACEYACTVGAQHDYCTVKRNVVYTDASGKKNTKDYKGKTCRDLESSPLGFEECDIDCGGTGLILENVQKAAEKCATECIDTAMTSPTAKTAICNIEVKYYEAGEIKTAKCSTLEPCKTKCAQVPA